MKATFALSGDAVLSEVWTRPPSGHGENNSFRDRPQPASKEKGMLLPLAETRRNKGKQPLVKSMDCDFVSIMSVGPVVMVVGKRLNANFNSR
jgi:hypothetical protein